MGYAITLGSLRCLSARVVQPAIGVWYVDVVVDPDDVKSVPTSGRAVVTLNEPGGKTTTLSGSIDPKYSGTYVANGRVRVLAGAGGWDDLLPPAEWSSSGGVRSSDVLTQTAAAVGETINVTASSNLGARYERLAGPARRVFGDGRWYVDLAGVTQLGPRPTPATPAGLELLFFDPGTGRAVLTADELVTPGLVLSDPRLNGATPTVRDVVHTFDAQGDRAEVWCASAEVSRLPAGLKALVREWAGVAYLKDYRYRYIQPSASGGLTLQAVTDGAPPINDIPEGSGMAGVVAKLGPGTIVYVRFVNGDPNDPIVTGYDTSTAVLELDLAGGAAFVGLSPVIDQLLSAIVAAFNAHTHPAPGGATGQPTPVALPPVVIPIPTPVQSTAATKVKAT
jgi:hypothetical protein